eukprot:TRINITY_DN1706_c0_g1_i14.p1 TRINITY_DN1706_c0_g1~~TRINITY_DN1706_c0_g1_i14.p1  ORF type:complete len:252 (+),score=19.15 TRINITY_DN1706_c0_g1_i14:62-817(+)
MPLWEIKLLSRKRLQRKRPRNVHRVSRPTKFRTWKNSFETYSMYKPTRSNSFLRSQAQREDMFTEHFLACMVQMTEDISVAVAGIDLSYKLARLDILTEKDIDNLYGLVSDFNRKIKYEVAKFINDYFLETVVTNKTKSKIASSRKVTPDHPKFLATSKILALLDLIENNTSHKNLPDYVVDALWGQTEILTYWEVMTDLMLNPGDKMAGSDYVLLAKFLSVCIKREAAEDVVPRNKCRDSCTFGRYSKLF